MVGFRAIGRSKRKAYIQSAKPRSHDLGMPSISNTNPNFSFTDWPSV